MFEIKEIEAMDAPRKRSLASQAISAGTALAFAWWTCFCFFGC